MTQIRVAGAQIPVTRSIQSNLEAIGRAIDYAIAEQADILLTPEGSLSGYTPHFDPQQVYDALEIVTQRAREAKLALALGTCFVEPADGRCYNQIRFYRADGTYLGFHSKTLRCGTLTDPLEGEINHYSAQPLRLFDLGGVPVGGLICNDLWANPGCTPLPDTHLTHQLARMGARIVLHAVNGGRDGSEWSREVNWSFHESNLRMRARASHVWIVTVDNCYPIDIPCSAPSGVIDPSGDWVAKVPNQGEQFFAYTIHLAE